MGEPQRSPPPLFKIHAAPSGQTRKRYARSAKGAGGRKWKAERMALLTFDVRRLLTFDVRSYQLAAQDGRGEGASDFQTGCTSMSCEESPRCRGGRS